MDRVTTNGSQLNDKNIVSYNKIFEVVLNRESHLTSSPQYTEVYDMAHTLNTLNCEFWWNTVLLQVQIHRVNQVSINKTPKSRTDIRKMFTMLGKDVSCPTQCHEQWIIFQQTVDSNTVIMGTVICLINKKKKILMPTTF